jgi:hypothetical protein
MKSRPILFSAPMVNAILGGRKKMTRRLVKLPEKDGSGSNRYVFSDKAGKDRLIDCPYGRPGDRLIVRETWAAPHQYDHLPPRLIPHEARIHYAATEHLGGLRGRPSIHMPHWCSRITLEVVSVRVERLNDISAEDARAEGCEHPLKMAPIDLVIHAGDYVADERTSFAILWKSINGADSWSANPWVWVVEFKRLP